MRRFQISMMLAAVVLLASCGGKTSLEFSNYEKQANASTPEGVPAEMTLSFAIPKGECEVQVIDAEKQIIEASMIAQEVGTPEGETLQQVADNYIERFKAGIAEEELEASCVYQLQITCQYHNAQTVVFHVTDGIYGNGGPHEYLKIMKTSDGSMVERDQIVSLNAAERSMLVGRFVDSETAGMLFNAEIEDFWVAPDSAGCRIKLQTGSHFFYDVFVPTEEIARYLTDEGKVLFGLASGQKEDAEEADSEKKTEMEESEPDLTDMTPEQRSRKAWDCYVAKDYNGFCRYIFGRDGDPDDLFFQGLKEAYAHEGGVVGYEIVDVEKSDKRVVVKEKLKLGNGKTEINKDIYKKRNGVWELSFR